MRTRTLTISTGAGLVGEAVAALMERVEVGGHRRAVGNIEFVALAVVAKIGERARCLSRPSAAKSAVRMRFELGEGFCRDHASTGSITVREYSRMRVGEQDADGGERAGQRGNQDARNAERAREATGVDGASAAEGDEREVARVVAALDGDDADGLCHGGFDRRRRMPAANSSTVAMGPLAGFMKCARARARSSATAPPRKLSVSSRPSTRLASVTVGRSPRPKQMGPGSAPADSGPTRSIPPAIEARERSAAGAGGVDVEHGHADGDAGDAGLVADAEAAGVAVDERNVSRGAAHVEADDAIEAGGGRELPSADDSAGGAGEDGAHRLRGGEARGDDAAGGLHHFEHGRCAYRRSTCWRVERDRCRRAGRGRRWRRWWRRARTRGTRAECGARWRWAGRGVRGRRRACVRVCGLAKEKSSEMAMASASAAANSFDECREVCGVDGTKHSPSAVTRSAMPKRRSGGTRHSGGGGWNQS